MTQAMIKIESDMRKLPTPDSTKEGSHSDESPADDKTTTAPVDDQVRIRCQLRTSRTQGSDGSVVTSPELCFVLDGSRNDDRRVTVVGNAEQQFLGQQWVFAKVRVAQSVRRPRQVCETAQSSVNHTPNGSRASMFDQSASSKLCVELRVPARLVGRIIGKGGAAVRDLQNNTGAAIKVRQSIAGDD